MQTLDMLYESRDQQEQGRKINIQRELIFPFMGKWTK